MGLFKAGIGAFTGVLSDQWREYFYCEALPVEVLVTKGFKKKNGKSSNNKGQDNIISNGSIIAVNEGQCMIIVDQGKIVEVCAEPGEFVFDSSTEPSIFAGGFGKALNDSFLTMAKRFTMAGDTGKDQRVYFFNAKEIYGNKYGTPNPVPFRVVDTNIGLDVDIAIRCHGEYSYKITNPILFYTNVCGNVEGNFTRENIDSQLKSELMTALQPTFAKISAMGIRYSALPGHTQEIANVLNDILSEKWAQNRGIEVAVFGVSSVTASPEDENMIKELQKSAVLRNPNMAAAVLAGAQAEAMKSAAANESAGPMMAFAGLNMANSSGGMNAGNLFNMNQGGEANNSNNNYNQAYKTSSNGGFDNWTCSCGAVNTGKFCTECAKPKPGEINGWTCSCGAINKGKFCAECGSKKPADELLYKCDKCGWEPEDPKNPPRFCPECGDVFDDNDVKK